MQQFSLTMSRQEYNYSQVCRKGIKTIMLMGLARSKVGLRRASICLTSWYFTRTNPQCVWDRDLGQVYGVEMDMKISPR